MPASPFVRTRFAPSPTGDLHLGGAWVALASWAHARIHQGQFVLRIEDIDRPRVVARMAERIQEDLLRLGLGWDGAPMVQSDRTFAYADAIEVLRGLGLVYACDCSRAEIARVASAPHAGEELVYPGTCRDRDPGRAMKRSPALRLRVPLGGEPITFSDAALGAVSQSVASEVGDFVLRRGDGQYAYQLAVVVDDLAQGVSDVFRGADLLASTPRQILLANLLGGTPPQYAHLSLVVDAHGARLAKRTSGARVRQLLDNGLSPQDVIGVLAHGLGLTPDAAPRSPDEVVRVLACPDTERRPWPVHPFRIPEAWVARLPKQDGPGV